MQHLLNKILFMKNLKYYIHTNSISFLQQGCNIVGNIKINLTLFVFGLIDLEILLEMS